MAKVTVFASEKGGTGKSTNATNMAVQRRRQGGRVLLIDADPQGTTLKWASRRSMDDIQPAVKCVELTAAKLIPFLEKYADQYDDIIIDTGGADSNEMRVALMVADIVVCPTQPSQADIETLEHVDTLIGKAVASNPDMRAYVLTSKASTHAQSTAAEDMRTFCEAFKHLPILTTIVRERQPFRDALRDGLGVVEMPVSKLTEKAIAESQQLEKEIWK